MTIIGNDLLPYTYIDKVNLYDNYVQISAHCVGQEGEWNDNSLALKYYRMMIITSTSTSLGNLIRTGNINLHRNTVLKEDPKAQISIFKIQNVDKLMNGEQIIFKKTVKHSYDNSGGFLYAYAVMMVDPVEVAGPKYIKEGIIQGPVAAENILSNQFVNIETSVFVLPNGDQWAGPVHRHPERGFMQYSNHSPDIEHSLLQRVTVPNIKVSDKRRTTSRSKFISSSKNNLSQISELFNSFGQSGNSNSIFFADIKEIIANNTKYGNVFKSLGEQHILKMISDLRLSLLAIDRETIKSGFVNSNLVKTRTYESKRILTSHQTQNGDFNVTFGGNQIKKTVFPFDNTVSSFEFTDISLTPNVPGEFQYTLLMSFMDPTITAANLILDELNTASYEISKYIGRIKRNLKTKSELDNPPESWVSSELMLYESDTTMAPWIMAPMIYAKYKKMFFDIDLTSGEIELNSIFAIEPKSFTINNINSFKSDLDNLRRHILGVFNIRTSKVSNFSVRSMPKNTYMSNLVNIRHQFKKVIQPSQNKKYYNFLDNTGDFSFTKRITPSQFRERISIENAKFFDSLQNSEDIVNDTITSAASYFSPISMQEYGATKIDLMDLQNVNVKKVNRFFDIIPKKKSRKTKPQKKNKFVIVPRVIDIKEENYIRASEYLGIDSTFLNMDVETVDGLISETIGVVESLNISITKEPTQSKRKFILGEPDGIFSPNMTKRAPQNTNQRILIPNQLRSLNHRKVSGAKEIFTEEELADPKNNLVVSVNYFNLIQIESMVGFKRKEDGALDMKNPIWKIVINEDIGELGQGTFCKMIEVRSAVFDHERDTRTELNFSDKYFIISEQELSSLNDISTISAESTSVQDYLTSIPYKIAGMTNEVLEQNVTTEEQIFKSPIKTVTVTEPRFISRVENLQNTSTPASIVRSNYNRGGGY